jgi:hypothetical protein
MSPEIWSGVNAGNLKKDLRVPTSVPPRVADGRIDVDRPKQFLLSMPIQVAEPRINKRRLQFRKCTRNAPARNTAQLRPSPRRRKWPPTWGFVVGAGIERALSAWESRRWAADRAVGRVTWSPDTDWSDSVRLGLVARYWHGVGVHHQLGDVRSPSGCLSLAATTDEVTAVDR